MQDGWTGLISDTGIRGEIGRSDLPVASLSRTCKAGREHRGPRVADDRMHTCTKIYHDIPFAHRQHRHAGHCALVHGHNWSFRFTFGAARCDENGFVVDFGRLKFVRAWLEEQFDHACVFNRDDPLRMAIVAAAPQAYKVRVVDSCSCEGIAEMTFRAVDALVRAETGGRAFLVEVEVLEDSRNSACYRPDLGPASRPT